MLAITRPGPRPHVALAGQMRLTSRSPRSPTLEDVLDSPEPARPSPTGPSAPIRGVITDWGGVMTGSIRDMVRVWLDDEDIDPRHYTAVMRPWVLDAYQVSGNHNPIHALERGESTPEEFEREASPVIHSAGATMSFFRHGEIYQSDEQNNRNGERPSRRPPAHRPDESPAGYSSASCSPAELASASPAERHPVGEGPA